MSRVTATDRHLSRAEALQQPRLIDRWLVGDPDTPPTVSATTTTTASAAAGARDAAPHSHAVAAASRFTEFERRHTPRIGAAMARQVASYRPRDIAPADFAAIEAFVKDVVAETANVGHKDPLAHVHSVASFVHWAHNLHGRELDRRTIFSVPLILHFTERNLSGRSDGYISTYRSRLMSVARQVNARGVVEMPTRQRRGVNNPPYTAGEVGRFLLNAQALSRPYARRNATLMTAFSAGAGLNPSDYVRLRNHHIVIDPEGHDTGVQIDVPQGAGTARTSLRPRRVLMLHAYEGPVRILLGEENLDPDAFALWSGVTKTRENLQALTGCLRRVIPNPQERPVISRLRTTWLVRHLTLGTPTSVLLEASGLNSAESLHRYMDYVPIPDWDTSRRYLRGVE